MQKDRIIAARSNKHFKRLAYACILFVLLTLIIFSVVFNVSKENVLNIGYLNSTQLAQDLEYYLIEETNEIELAASTIEILQEQGKTNEDILEYLTFESKIVSETIYENYTGIYGFINGTYLDGSGWIPRADYEPQTRPWYVDGMETNGEVAYVTPYVDAETGSIMLSICKQLADRKSVVALDVSLDRIQTIVQSDRFMQYDQVIVTDKNNFVVSARDESLLGCDLSSDPLILAFLNSEPNQDSASYFVYRSDSGNKNAAFSTNVKNQWNVFLIVSSDKLMSSLKSVYAILGCGTLAFITFVTLTVDYLNKRRRAAENLNMQLESIADIYVSVHKFDIEKDKIEEIRSLPFVREMQRNAEQNASNSHEVLENVMKELTLSEYHAELEAFIDLSTLDSRVGDSNTIALELQGVQGWIKARIIVLERKNEKITSFLWMVENINEEKRKQNELRYLSETDLMTGIKNRGSGERLIKEKLDDRVGGLFCLLDADNFKFINDNYGHGVGDEVIKTIAEQLGNSFRKNDIILRLGGDEFAAYAVGINNREQAEAVLNRFVKSLNDANVPGLKEDRRIEVSIGASFATAGETKDFEVLYKEADTAMYMSKEKTGSCVTFFEAEASD